LARLVDLAFVGFSQAASRLPAGAVRVIGTPVRSEFQPGSAAAARLALGLEAQGPVLLVMGGSQGANAINEAMLRCLPQLKQVLPALQFVHLTGLKDHERVRSAYQAEKLRAVVRPFLTEMELALDAATVAVSRAGGSSLAELAAMRLPAILIPYPYAADDHQFHNARTFVEAGAARMLTQEQLSPELLTLMIKELASDDRRRLEMKRTLVQWHKADAAACLAEAILRHVNLPACGERGCAANEGFLASPETSRLNP
jgi:UDP-N-acetylglucosamine--N-acetylmuramyl-(pentapeptide) pyrophosphoryl-undecaprenol N-acetylglucosamine transferase